MNILCAYLTGEVISLLTGNIVPGSVIGMLVLFAALKGRLISSGTVKRPADFLLNNMLMFFLPVCAGIMVSYTIVQGRLWEVFAVIVLTTAIVLAVVAVMMQKLKRNNA